jgi:hypothetical protein
MRNTLLLIFFCMLGYCLHAQDAKTTKYTPYASIIAGGCVNMPLSFNAGIDRQIKPHFTLSYDLHFWNTKYESYCGDMYSKGRFTSITPSVKVSYYSSKKPGRGLIATLGLGYMFARDRGIEQPYKTNTENGSIELVNEEIRPGNWDFNSLAPNFGIGFGFRLFKLPIQLHQTYYFANTTEGWMPAAGGVGVKIGLKQTEK